MADRNLGGGKNARDGREKFNRPFIFPFQSGTTNPTVKLFYVDLEKVIQGNVNLIEIEHPTELSSEERILSAVAFPTDTLVYATWMNRVQNRAYFHFCYVHDPVPNCTTVRTHLSIHTDMILAIVVV